MKNSLKKLMAILMIVMLLSANIAGAAETGVLILPDSVKVIEEEAFMGDTSISHVVVPEGATDIGPRAFAGSSVSSLELP